MAQNNGLFVPETLVLPREAQASILDSLLTAGPPAGALVGAVMQLFQQDIPVSQGTTIEDLIAAVADYDGYVESSAITWTGPYTTPGYAVKLVGSSRLFVPTGDAVANTIFGYWLETPTGQLLGAERLALPVTLTGPTTSLSITPAYWIPGQL